jgi:NADPH:quinone reductase-like Zn-dependent oxidoreductase
MRAIYYQKHGGPDVLQYGQRPRPEVKNGDLLVRVHATSVNQVDWKLRRGRIFPVALFLSAIIPGRDVAGEVVETGKSVSGFKPGDKVFGMLDHILGGACAEYAVLPAALAVRMPPDLDYNQAAAVPLTALTALQALRDKGQLKPGDKVLVNGASSAVGLFAIQIARVLGAGEVTGVCGTQHVELVKEQGADRVIDYKKQDFRTQKNAYDIILDAVAKATYAGTKDCLRENGRYVTTVPDPRDIPGFVSSVFTHKKLKAVVVKNRASDLNLIRDWITAGKVRPIIDKVFALKDTAQAHRYSEKEHASGKIIVQVVP